MKAKSMKLRFLVTLAAIFKYSDRDHRMNGQKLNEFLRPYGLDCTSRVLNDTVAVLRDFGFDVRNKGVWDNQGIWIENRPLPDKKLNMLAFAVATNPYLTKEQVADALSALKPFVTVYQEPMLRCDVQNGKVADSDQIVYDAYMTICEAIQKNRRVRYTVSRMRYNKETGEVYEENEWPVLFTPKCIYRSHGHVYVVGYNHPTKCIEAVDLQTLYDVTLAFKHKDPNANKVQELLNSIEPQDYIPEERRQLIYKGPVAFRCRGQHLEELIKRFGMPDEPIVKDERCRATFILHEAEIWTDTLDWLACIPGRGIRIKGPEGLVNAVRTYYETVAETLLDARLLREKKRTGKS